MTEILFRGKRVDKNQIVFGDLLHGVNHLSGKVFILPIRDGIQSLSSGMDPLNGFEVAPETVSQFTGMTDKNGKKVFEGDVIKVKSKHGFNSELLNEFKELNQLDTLNGIGMHFKGIVRIDFLRGLMFENMENGYQEPMFTRHIDIKRNHSEIEVIGNIYEKEVNND